MPKRHALVALLLAVLLSACGPREPELPPEVEQTWEEFRETPNGDTYLRFLHANRLAAMRHANPGDAVGVLHQVRALEAQADQAVRTTDLRLAATIVSRVLEIEEGEVIDLYEEVLPGARERIRETRTAVEWMLE